jgi:hypothetical protein
VEQLDLFARENYKKRVIHLAMRWVLDREGIMVASWGAPPPDQVDAVSEIAGWKVDASAMREIDCIVASCVKQPVAPNSWLRPIGWRPNTAMKQTLQVSDRAVTLDVDDRDTPRLYVLRDNIGLPGPRFGCGSVSAAPALYISMAPPSDPA